MVKRRCLPSRDHDSGTCDAPCSPLVSRSASPGFSDSGGRHHPRSARPRGQGS
jgi:hypothetical protein